MSAMQARMTSQPQENADSEEESALTAGAVTAKSLTAQLRAKLKALEEKSVRSKHHAAIAAAASPSPPPVAAGPSAVPAKRLETQFSLRKCSLILMLYCLQIIG